MSDTESSLASQLIEIRSELHKNLNKQKRLREKGEKLEKDEQAIIRVLEMLGKDIPESATQTQPRKSARAIRAEDAALRVTVIGEEVNRLEVARRVAEHVAEFSSKNPANALTTAMSRSSYFESTGGGCYRRLGEESTESIVGETTELNTGNLRLHTGG